MKERLELVTEFATLRAGDYVEIRPCAACCAAHRGLLTTFGKVRGITRGNVDLSPGWKLAPETGCNSTSTVKRYAVAERRVYRIDTGLEDDSLSLANSTPLRRKKLPSPVRP